MSKQLISGTTSGAVELDLPVGDLHIDPSVQRSMLKMNRVDEIVRNFDPKALGRILVSERVGADYRVLDGWHRLEAVRRLTDNQGTIPVELYTGLSRQEEANLFLLRNAGQNPTLIDRYRVSLIAGDETMGAVDKLVHSFGWTVSTAAANGNLSCVQALVNLYKWNATHDVDESEPNQLQMALSVVTQAWGTEYAAGAASVLTAVGRVVNEYKGRLDISDLVAALKDVKGGPRGLTVAARSLASIRRMKLAMATAVLIVDEYNSSHRGRQQLQSWSKRL